MLAGLRFLLRALFRRGVMDRELDEELRFHLANETEKHMRAGLTRAQAERRAQREFGGIERIAEAARDVRGTAWIDGLLQDVRYGCRGLRARPGFAAAVVLTLGLGVGANTAMFGIVDRLLLRPPAFMHAPERVHRAYLTFTWDGHERSERSFAYLRYEDVRRFTTTLEAVGAYAYRTQVVGRGPASRELTVASVSASFFGFFDAPPELGRFFSAEDDVAPTGAAVAVLGFDYWQSAHAGSAAVLGEQVHIGDETYTIIGVAPRGFTGVTDGPAPIAFVPVTAFAHARAPDYAQNYGWSWLEIVVRRKPDSTREAAAADLASAFARSWTAQRALDASLPAAQQARVGGLLVPLANGRGPDAAPDARVAVWVWGVAFIVLLIACANVTSLLLARGVNRRREFALRLALGVSRPRLVQQLLVETFLLAVLGGIAGLLAARWGGAALRTLFLSTDDLHAVAGDARTLLFSAVLTATVALFTGLVPALQALRSDVGPTLKGGLPGNAVRGSTIRMSLLVAQGALCVLLLIGAGLFLRSFDNVRALRLGYDANALLMVSGNARGVRLSGAERDALADRLVETASALPDVHSATVIASAPFADFEGRGVPHVPGRDSLGLIGRYTLQVGSPTYFATTGTRILRGRGFQESDGRGAPPVVVISSSMADAIWPGEDPLGKQMRIGDETMPMLTVVGVTEDLTAASIGGPSALWYYLPVEQYRAMFGPVRPNLFVRVRGRAEAQAEAVRARLQREMPGDAYVRVAAFSTLLEPQQRSWRAGATMFGIFAALALVLAAVGLYSVLAYTVAQRTREIGIRMALGARVSNVMRLVAAQGLLFAAASTIAGTTVALLVARRVEPLLFDVSPSDPLVYGAVAGILLGVALIATAQPALRASRVDPSDALRAE